MTRLIAALTLILVSNITFAADRNDGHEPRAGAKREGRTMVLRPAAPLTDADRSELAQAGVHVRQPIGSGRFIARVAEGARVDDSRIASLELLSADWKIQRSAWREASGGRTWAELHVIFHDDIAFDDARQAILASGGSLRDPFATRFSPSHRLAVKIAPASLTALASDERVLAIAGPRRFRVQNDNANSAQLAHVTELYSAPYNLSGAGVTVSLFELAAAQATHPEFGGRLTAHVTTTGADSQHATHVAGTIGAAGLDARAKGMAPAVAIHQYCVTCNQESLEWIDIKDTELSKVGSVVDNNSWGYVLGWSSEDGLPLWVDADEYYGAYDLVVASPLDAISNEQGVLFVHSAGNDGGGPSFQTNFNHLHVDKEGETIKDKVFCYSLNNSGTDCPTPMCSGGCEVERHHNVLPFDTIGVTASAKNVVTVGALNGIGTAITSFSSRGPAKDGRIKPDVVARGGSVISTIPTNAYGSLSGTSMASPAVAGIAALIHEQWKKTFAGAAPAPAQVKGLLIFGADDIGNPGPDFTFGFGHVNAKNSVDAIIADEGKGKRIRSVSVGQGQTQELVVVTSETQKLKIVLNWADPAIAFIEGQPDIAPKALVNDLDLRVIDPSGATVLPFVLDKNNVNANATTGVNTVDNTEVVEIANAAPGRYRVLVAGTNVAKGPQTAVLISSSLLAPPCVDLQESNETPATAHGNLVPGQQVNGAICSQSDLDHFKFVATKSGTVTVTVTAFDTPIRATLTGTGISTTRDIAANSTGTLTAQAGSGTIPNAMTLKLEAAATLGADPRYKFIPTFPEDNQPRRRSVRK